ncbi:MAG: hypothetical protein ACM30I_16600 [Gemmatimonas sp.]
MVDSGGFVLSKRRAVRWTKDVVAAAFAQTDADIYVSLDLPPLPNDTGRRRRSKIRTSLRNYEFLLGKLPNKTLMPVVHGRTDDEVELSIQLIRSVTPQPQWVGVGGMVPLLQKKYLTPEISERTPECFIAHVLTRVRRSFPMANIHVFGAGGTRTFPAVYAFGADSADSIGWRQAAGFGSIFLPMKSQRLVAWPRQSKPPRKLLDAADLAEIQLCGCPVCAERPALAAKLRAFRRSFLARSVHNAWTVTNQASFWPRGRLAMLAAMSNGALGLDWQKAASAV